LSTDIIVGFPDESRQEFQETLSLLDIVRFTNIFSFRYSPRPLTSAAKMGDNVPFDEKKARLIEAQALQKKIQLEKNSSLIGQTQKVLCLGKSKKDPNIYSGRNEGYQVVNFKSDQNEVNRFVRIKISSCGAYSLFGEVV
jgi:tRNA-2-methylthio-N6-dimethylallyladenosine synthase